MIQVESSAPIWAQRLARDAQSEIDDSLGLFISRVPFTVATLPAADKHTNKIALLSNGTFWLAKSNGTDWLYPDMTTV